MHSHWVSSNSRAIPKQTRCLKKPVSSDAQNCFPQNVQMIGGLCHLRSNISIEHARRLLQHLTDSLRKPRPHQLQQLRKIFHQAYRQNKKRRTVNRVQLGEICWGVGNSKIRSIFSAADCPAARFSIRCLFCFSSLAARLISAACASK